MDAAANGSMSVLKYALEYLGAGFSVLPIRRDGTKAAACEWGIHGSGQKDKTTGQIITPPRLMREDEAKHWWGGFAPPGIAIACGKISGNLEVIDFDYRAEQNVPMWIFAVECERPGLIEKLTRVHTPRSEHSRHFWYRCQEPEVTGNQKLAEEIVNSNSQQAMIETRGEGGYALVPGTPPQCHDTGRCYIHVAGPPFRAMNRLTPQERSVLIRCAEMLDLKSKPEDYDGGRLPNSQLLPGTDFMARGPDWAQLLEPHGWVCVRQFGTVRYWRRPGKEKGHSATTGVCTSKSGHELFAVFSSNAHPFSSSGHNGKACGNYNKFAAYTLLNHSGDFAAAAESLRVQGFGNGGPIAQTAKTIETAKKEQAEALADKEEAERRLADAKAREKNAAKEAKDSEKKEQDEKIRIGFSGLGFEFINGEWVPGRWKVSIVRSEPVTYRLFAPFLKDCGILLTDDEFDSPTMVHKRVLRATGNICLADRPQAWEWLWNGYKNIRAMKAKLLDGAENEEAPPEVKRSVVVAQWLFKRLQHCRRVKDRSEIDGGGGAYLLEDESVVFDFTYVWTDGAKSEDKIKRPEMSHLLDNLGRDHCWRGKKMFDVLDKGSLDKLESMLKPDQKPK